MEFNINELIDRVARGETPQEVLENVKNADVDALIERVISGETPESVLTNTVHEADAEGRPIAVGDRVRVTPGFAIGSIARLTGSVGEVVSIRGSGRDEIVAVRFPDGEEVDIRAAQVTVV